MSERSFWTSEARTARSRPHGPDEVRGVPCVDGWRAISGIVHVPRNCYRRVDAPAIMVRDR